RLPAAPPSWPHGAGRPRFPPRFRRTSAPPARGLPRVCCLLAATLFLSFPFDPKEKPTARFASGGGFGYLEVLFSLPGALLQKRSNSHGHGCHGHCATWALDEGSHKCVPHYI